MLKWRSLVCNISIEMNVKKESEMRRVVLEGRFRISSEFGNLAGQGQSRSVSAELYSTMFLDGDRF